MSYDFPCDWHLPFDRAERKARVGFLTTLAIAGYRLEPDLQLYSAPEDAPIQAVAVIENIAWDGTPFGMLSISCYISRENSIQLRSMMGGNATTSIVDIGGWLANWDENANQWYYEFYPEGPETLTALLTNDSGDIRLEVSLEGNTIVEDIGDLEVYHVQFEIIPAANRLAAFILATSPTLKHSLPWGELVGSV
jgi:hypothetical protein